jgi:hypothetical protein
MRKFFCAREVHIEFEHGGLGFMHSNSTIDQTICIMFEGQISGSNSRPIVWAGDQFAMKDSDRLKVCSTAFCQALEDGFVAMMMNIFAN